MVTRLLSFRYNSYVTSNKGEMKMNSYLYDDVEIEETPEFQLYQTEAEYWTEYDQSQKLRH